MRAAVYHGPRDVRLEDVPEPSGAPGPEAVRLRVLRVALCGTDVGEYVHGPLMVPLHARHPGSGHRGPLVLGHELVGEVEAVGSAVDSVVPGDRVVPGAGMWCGVCAWCRAGRTNLCASYYTIGLNADGGLTERLDVPARMCRAVPDGCPDEAAAMAQPLAVALHAVHRAGVAPDEAAVLIGAGGIGLFVLAGLVAARARVVVLDVDEGRLAAARRLGARAALDARADDVAEAVAAALGGDPVDVVLEASGAPGAPAQGQALVRRGGRLVLVGLQAAPRSLDLGDLVLREVDLRTSVAHVCDHDLGPALAALAAGGLAAEALGRVVDLEGVVEEGLEPLAAGEVAGKVVVRVG